MSNVHSMAVAAAVALAAAVGRAAPAARQPAGQPPLIAPAQFASGEFDCKHVRMRGFVRELFPDQHDDRFTYGLLVADGDPVYFAVHRKYGEVKRFLHAEVVATGSILPNIMGQFRTMIGRTLQTGPGRFEVIREAPSDPFDAPSLGDVSSLNKHEIDLLPPRTIEGEVVASWGRDSILLHSRLSRMEEKNVHRIILADASRGLPAAGTRIVASGLPYSSIYRANLRAAAWKPAPPQSAAAPAPGAHPAAPAYEIVAADGILRHTDKEFPSPHIEPKYDGRRVAIDGIVVRPADPGALSATIDSGGTLVEAKASRDTFPALAALRQGDTVRVKGVCVMETENETGYFPKMRGFFVALDSPAPQEILAPAPLLTRERLLRIALASGAAVAFLAAWTAILCMKLAREKRLAVRRETAAARAAEREKLSDELHNSTAQSLASIGLMMRTAADIGAGGGKGGAILGRAIDSANAALWEVRRKVVALRTPGNGKD